MNYLQNVCAICVAGDARKKERGIDGMEPIIQLAIIEFKQKYKCAYKLNWFILLDFVMDSFISF